MAFIHLQNHSEYSMLQAALRTKKIVGAAKEFNQHSVALTDNGNMFGVLEFYFGAERAGIKPIIGCDIYVKTSDSGLKTGFKWDRIILIAKNDLGYNNLMKIVTYGHLEGFDQKPLVSLDFIKENSAGLFAIYGGMSTILYQELAVDRLKQAEEWVNKYQSIFDKEHFYVAVQNHGIPEESHVLKQLKPMAASIDFNMVVTNNNHYLKQADAEAHRILICIERGEKLSEHNPKDFTTDQFYYRSPGEMEEAFADWPEELANSEKIAEQCHIKIEINIGDKYWPKFNFPEGFNDSDDYLAHMVWERAGSFYPDMDDVTKERIQFELDIMKEMKVAGYMLIVQDFINWSKDNGVPVGPGRGSAVGSVVCYIIGIVSIEPMRFGLLFERFLNPERVSMPDIDTDFSDKGREKVIKYVTETYGKECVSQIVTYGRMKAKAVIRDVGRALEVPLADVDFICKIIPLLGYDLKKSYDEFSELRGFIESKDMYRQLWKQALKLEGLARQPGIHAAAVIIAPRPLVELAPLYKAPGDDAVVIQYDKAFAEDVGFLKMDFLGLRNLSVIQDTIEMVKQGRNQEVDIDNVDIHDEKTYSLLSKGLTTGVFQFESPGMQEYLRKLKPTCLEDMIAMNALYRPGPIAQIPRFIACKHGQQEIDCYLEDLEPILGETYGVIVYQEQVMMLAQQLSGFTLGGADLMRRAMAKKKDSEMAKLHPKFVDGATEREYPKNIAERIWEDLGPFCAYAFNKSHSAAYGFIGYQTAYLKAHFGPEYLAANLTSELTSPDRLVILLQECKALNIEILPPCVNRSLGVFSVISGKVNYGLGGIKNVGMGFLKSMILERTENGFFTTLFELTERTISSGQLNKRALESLIMAGALDVLAGNRAEQYASIDLAIEYANRVQKDKDSGQVGLFDTIIDTESNTQTPKLEVQDPWTHIELLAKEKEVIGMYISGHPLEEFQLELQGFSSSDLHPLNIAKLPISEKKRWGAKESKESKIILGGVMRSLRTFLNKNNQAFGIGTLEDFHGTIDVTMWTDAWEKVQDVVSIDAMLLIEGKIEYGKDGETRQLNAESAVLLEDARTQWTRFVHVTLKSEGLVESFLRDLEILTEDFEYPDKCKLVFHIKTPTEHTHILQVNSREVSSEVDFIEELQDMVGKENIKLSRSF
jgi:DNA polymerase-3 subunit alpha